MSQPFQKKQEEELVKRFEASLKKNDPLFFDLESFEIIIDHYLDRSKNKKALEAVNQAIKLYPYSTELISAKAQILTNLEEYEAAIELLHQARNLNPNDLDLIMNLAWIVASSQEP